MGIRTTSFYTPTLFKQAIVYNQSKKNKREYKGKYCVLTSSERTKWGNTCYVIALDERSR